MATTVSMARYGNAALEALREGVARAKVDDPLAPVTIIVPSNVAGLSVRRALASGVGGRAGIVALTVTTLGRLAETLVAGRMGGRRPATRPVLTAAWRRAIGNEPGSLGDVAQHPATIRALMRAQTELRDLDAAQSAAIAAGGALAADVVRLLRDVRAGTTAFYDEVDIFAVATAGLADGWVSMSGSVILFLPQLLTQHERALLAALVAVTHVNAMVGLSGDAPADRGVIDGLRAAGIDIPKHEQPSATCAARVVHASDSDDEVRWVVREVMGTLSDRPGHRIAVLYASADPYARLLHDHLSDAGIAIAGVGVSPVRERAVARGLLALLSLPSDDFARADVFAALGQAPVRRTDGTRTPTGRWERLSREAGVVSGDDWTTRLNAYAEDARAKADALAEAPDVDESGVERNRRRADDAIALRDFVEGMRREISAGLALRNWPELSEWVTAFFHQLFGPGDGFIRLPLEERTAVATIETVIAALGELAAIEPVASFATLRDVVETELDGALPSVGSFGTGVYLAPISQAIGLDVDQVFVVGAAEDSFPGRLTPDPVLPESVRDLSDGGLKPGRAQIDARRRQWAAALELGATVTFPRGNLRQNTPRLPSRWLLPSLRELSGQRDLSAANWARAQSERIISVQSFWSELRRTPHPATEQEWRVQAVASGTRLDDSRIDVSLAMISARASSAFTRFDGDLRGVDGLPNFAVDDRVVAPTTLERFAGCPHSYFVQDLLGVRPIENPEEIVRISPLDRGNVIHRSLDRLVTELGSALPGYGEPWTAAHKSRLREIAVEEGLRISTLGLAGHPRLWSHELALILRELDWMLDNDSELRAAEDRRVLGSELVFGRRGAAPVDVPVDGGVVHISGSIDRVDERRDGTLFVIDVKTGSARSFSAVVDDPVVHGTKLQLPAYALAAQQFYGRDRAEAAYWFTSGKNRGDVIRVKLDADTGSLYRQTIGTLADGIAEGLFLNLPPADDDRSYVQCPFCNPDGVGYADVRIDYDRKRGDPALAGLLGLIDPANPESEDAA